MTARPCRATAAPHGHSIREYGPVPAPGRYSPGEAGLHSIISKTEMPDGVLSGVRTVLSAVASGIDARFVQAGSALASAYDIVERLVASLEGVTNALDREAGEAAIGNMRAAADSLARLPHLQRDRQGDLETIGSATKALRDHVAQVQRTLSFLRICGLNIKVAAAGAEEFSGFAEIMFVQLDLGAEQLAGFEREAARLLVEVTNMAKAEKLLASECAHVIPHVPIKLADDALALQQYQGETAALAGRIAEVARMIRAKLATALGAIQIGDITRQRLEHVADGIQTLAQTLAAFVEQHPDIAPATIEAVEGRIVALLAAQVEDTTADFLHEARSLSRSLRGIAPDASRLLALKGDTTPEADGESFLLRLEQDIAGIDSVTSQLREAEEQTDRLGGATSVIAEQLARRLDVVRHVQSDVEQMAWNTGLRCRRMGEDGLALAAIATEIRQFSNNLGVISGRISQTFAQLGTAAGAIRARREQDGKIDAGRTLAESLSSIRAGSERMQRSLGGLDGEASAMVTMLRESTDNVNCEAEIGEALATATAQLATLADADADLPETAATLLAELFGAIARTYTMARERDVHRRLTGDFAEQVHDEPAAEDATTDEDLFEDALF